MIFRHRNGHSVLRLLFDDQPVSGVRRRPAPIPSCQTQRASLAHVVHSHGTPEKLLNDPELTQRFGAAGRERAEGYTLEAVLPQVMEKYTSLHFK